MTNKLSEKSFIELLSEKHKKSKKIRKYYKKFDYLFFTHSLDSFLTNFKKKTIKQKIGLLQLINKLDLL